MTGYLAHKEKVVLQAQVGQRAIPDCPVEVEDGEVRDSVVRRGLQVQAVQGQEPQGHREIQGRQGREIQAIQVQLELRDRMAPQALQGIKAKLVPIPLIRVQLDRRERTGQQEIQDRLAVRVARAQRETQAIRGQAGVRDPRGTRARPATRDLLARQGIQGLRVRQVRRQVLPVRQEAMEIPVRQAMRVQKQGRRGRRATQEIQALLDQHPPKQDLPGQLEIKAPQDRPVTQDRKQLPDRQEVLVIPETHRPLQVRLAMMGRLEIRVRPVTLPRKQDRLARKP